MDRTLLEGDPSCLIKARLSFPQILLLVSYIHLESSLPASIGDTRQLQDILRRREDEWTPRIGLETYLDMKQRSWTDTSWQTRRAWDAARKHFLQQKLIDHTVSSRNVRRYLSNLLCCIEQISAQSLNTIHTNHTNYSTKLGMPLSEKANFVMICFSVGVIATEGEDTTLETLLADPDQSIINELGSELCMSPLFNEGVSLPQLWDSCTSLDTLFCHEKCRVMDHRVIYAKAPDCSPKAKVITRNREACIFRYSQTETEEIVYPDPASSHRSKRAWQTYLENEEVVSPNKRQLVISPNKARKQLKF